MLKVFFFFLRGENLQFLSKVTWLFTYFSIYSSVYKLQVSVSYMLLVLFWFPLYLRKSRTNCQFTFDLLKRIITIDSWDTWIPWRNLLPKLARASVKSRFRHVHTQAIFCGWSALSRRIKSQKSRRNLFLCLTLRVCFVRELSSVCVLACFRGVV